MRYRIQYPGKVWGKIVVDEAADGLDGIAVKDLLQGAVVKGHDPLAILRDANIDPGVYGNAHAAIDGSALVRLVRQIQFTLDDVYLGFFAHNCRMALETERLLSFLHCSSFGEALRVSIRFTDAMSTDVGPWISEEHGPGLQHICKYMTVPGVDRDILVWIRFVWIYHLFSWMIGRPLALREISVRGSKPVQANGFDRFALFRCPVKFNAPVDALSYDRHDLTVRLVPRSINDYDEYYASEPDWFASLEQNQSWRERTQTVLIELQKAGLWSAPIEVVAARLRTRPRRLRHDLAQEGESFQDIRTRLRGELAGAYLLASDLPVTAIGFELGFSEPGSFSRHFISWAGMAPSAYRATHVTDTSKVAAATALLNERRGT
ncbi:MAG: AraC family transcriptional regulator [Alphaproteobacteria bacterium]|nr:MAG: AraC family transcriptional regulator [Alphaproteobacteria bacterium]